jgi:hypothetical protein
MRDGFRYALLLAAGLVALLFIVAFTAWGLTTYGSIRHVVGDLAAQPESATDLESQYEDMLVGFASGANSFTYHFRSAPVTVTPAQVSGMDEDQAIGLVLDVYTSGLYDNTLQSGGLGAASFFIGSTGNIIYAVIALVFALLSALLVAGAVLGFDDSPRPLKLKSAGKTIAAFCAVLFFIFALLPGLLKSLFWGSVASSDAARELLSILEPGIVGTLLRNTLLVIIVAGVLYAAGYWTWTKGEVKEMLRSSRAAAQKAEHPVSHEHEHAQENHKRRSL